MNVRDAIKKAVETNDLVWIGQIVDKCRNRAGMSYKHTMELFQEHTTLDEAGFEALMQEVEAAV